MIRIDLDLEDAEDLRAANARWRFAPGLVPGEPNEGLTARLAGSPARLGDYDDSGWETCDNIQETQSSGFTFGWYRIAVTIPDRVAWGGYTRVPPHSSRPASTTMARCGSTGSATGSGGP